MSAVDSKIHAQIQNDAVKGSDIMKVAIATDDKFVADHFGRCQKYTIFNIENDIVVSREEMDCPPHERGVLPEMLSGFGVNIIIAGGMGTRAQNMFLEKGIEAIIGVSGDIDEVISSLIEGTLETGESRCKPRHREGHGGRDHSCEHDTD